MMIKIHYTFCSQSNIYLLYIVISMGSVNVCLLIFVSNARINMVLSVNSK